MAVLALGIGANTAIFSLIDAVVFRPLPYFQAERLVSVATLDKRGSMNTSWPTFRDWSESTHAFEYLAAYRGETANLSGGGDPLRVDIAYTSPEMLVELTGAWAGKLKVAGQDAVVSYGFWMRRFGGDRNALGRTLVLDGKSYSVAGILPGSFRFPRWQWVDEPDIYLPLAHNPDRQYYFLRVIGRLKPGVTPAQAQADMDSIAASVERAKIRSLQDELVWGTRETLKTFGVAVLLVLLIGCANVSNLLLSQAVRREQEVAIRSALGAGRLRLVRQFLAESAVLGLCGGGFGLLVAFAGMPLLEAVVPAHTGMSTRVGMGGVGLNWKILGFSLGLSLFAALLFGVLPALRAASGGRKYRRKERVRGLLIAAEVGLSLMLLASAGLLTKSFLRLLAVNPGFKTRALAVVEMRLPELKYADVRERAKFVESVLARIESMPGVRSAAAINEMPLTLTGSRVVFNQTGTVGLRIVTPGYFQTMQIPLVRGRLLTRDDADEAVINRAMAQKYWPKEDPIGQTIDIPGGRFRIAGVVGDVRHMALDRKPAPEMFLPFARMATGEFHFVLRTSEEPGALGRNLKAAIWAVDRDQPLGAVRTMDELIHQDVSALRFAFSLLLVFAMVALLLAVSGVFAVVAHSVSQRTKEIGIRMALGAGARSVAAATIRQTSVWIGTGLLFGIAGTFMTARLLGGYLYDVQPHDPPALALAAILLAMLGLLAALIPAKRATRVDPASALRYE